MNPHRALCSVLRHHLALKEAEIRLAFGPVFVEPDTKLYGVRFTEYGGILARLEAWAWDGFGGRTIVFRQAQVAAWSEPELVALTETITAGGVSEAPGFGKYTFTRDKDLVYVNFGIYQND